MSPDGDITLLVTLRSHVLPHCCPSVSHCSHNGRSKLGDRNAEAVPAEGVNSSKSDRKIIISVRTAAEEFRHVWWGGTPACGAVARSRGLAPAVDPRGGGWGKSLPASQGIGLALNIPASTAQQPARGFLQITCF